MWNELFLIIQFTIWKTGRLSKFARFSAPATAKWAMEYSELFDTVYIMSFFIYTVCIVGDKGVIQNQDLYLLIIM